MRHLSRLLFALRSLHTAGNGNEHIFLSRVSAKEPTVQIFNGRALDYASNVQGQRLGNSENLAATCLHRHSAEVAADFRVRRNGGDSRSSIHIPCLPSAYCTQVTVLTCAGSCLR